MVVPCIDSLLQAVYTSASSKILERFKDATEAFDELIQLDKELYRIDAVLHDANNREIEDQGVKLWLEELEVAALGMGRILEKWRYAELCYQNARKDHGACLSAVSVKSFAQRKVCVKLIVQREMRGLRREVEHLMKGKEQIQFVFSLPRTDQKASLLPSTSFIDAESFLDRKVLHDLEKMLGGSDGYRRVCLVGIGGVGKTALAQMVYHKLKGSFDVGIWISANGPFSLASVCKEIVHKLSDATVPITDQTDFLLEWMTKFIQKKTFFLVLDDVCSERWDDLDPLRLVLSKASLNSRILVTTRSEKVPALLGIPQHQVCQVNKLTNKESWNLLLLVSGFSRFNAPFKVRGEEVVEKCGGLPLALVVLGRLLQGKNEVHDWTRVLSNIDIAPHKVFTYLTSNYTKLSLCLKRCFSYLGVYCNGTELEVKSQDLVEDWMAMGYLRADINFEAEVRGQHFIEELVKLSLFRASGNRILLSGLGCDYARFLKLQSRIGKGKVMEKKLCSNCKLDLSFGAIDYRTLLKANIPKVCDCLLRLRILRFAPNLHDTPIGLEKLIHLRLLQLTGNDLSDFNLKSICRLYFLQTLRLRDCSLQEIPSEVGNLVDLRHLDLSKNSLRNIPQEVGNLTELRSMELSDNAALKELPKALKNCVKLQTLGIKRCPISADQAIGSCKPCSLGTSFLQVLSSN